MFDKSKYLLYGIADLKKKLTLQASLKKVMTSREKPFLSVHGLVIHMKKRSGLEADIGSLTVAKTNCKPIKNVFFNGFLMTNMFILIIKWLEI